jgi:DNA invertase Pin-like site-specific DNA recombinase
LQVDACRATAHRFDVQVTHELIEPPSTSAYKDRGRSRPRFKELLALIGHGEVDAVVVYNTDRLSRGGGPG